ncbi:MAG: hypothetical protein A2X11_12465 [Bacteroidetes bacterium GWE2_42_24]|nr:MAG: hypothetical protein A2X11_12465 [Bacteroidetes bacterium GWE2_42_24]
MSKTLKTYLRASIVLIPLLAFAITAQAQEGVKASVDTTHLVIGQPTHLTLTFRFPEGARTGWPQWSDTLTGNIEILKRSKIDTLPAVNGLTGLQQILTISVYDSGMYFVPPIQVGFRRENDTAPTLFVSNPIALMVNTVAVDTTKAFRDIKGLIKAPITFREILPVLGIGLGTVIIIIVAIWLIRRFLRKEPIFAVRPKIALPPDVEAIKFLEALRLKKLWQNGQVKLYYTELSDIIRHYLERRFDIQAAEKTSSEIMTEVSQLKLDRETASYLEGVLLLADLAKFAKMEPLPLENDTALNSALSFVRETKPEIHSTPEQEEIPLNEQPKS